MKNIYVNGRLRKYTCYNLRFKKILIFLILNINDGTDY